MPTIQEIKKKLEGLDSTSVKVSLKETLWPSLSVSTRTPSQSNRRAAGSAEDEAEHLTRPELLFLLMGFECNENLEDLMVMTLPTREDG